MSILIMLPIELLLSLYSCSITNCSHASDVYSCDMLLVTDGITNLIVIQVTNLPTEFLFV